jgi:hypothetical protein
LSGRREEETFVQRFNSPFRRQTQVTIPYPARWLAVWLGGDGVANSSGFYRFRCVAHDDQNASGSMKDTPRGLYIKCHAGCSETEVRAAILDIMKSGAFTDQRAPEPEAAAAVQNNVDLMASAARTWHESPPIAVTQGEFFFRQHRGIDIPLPAGVLRFHPACWHKESNTRAPAVIALLQDATGQPRAIHRIWLDPRTGNKANLKPVRKSLAPTSGHSVHLAEPEDLLAVCEGVETGLAFQQLRNGIPVWAALSAPGIANLIVPDRVREVIIACDNDRVCIDAADRLARRLRPRVSVSLQLPPLDFPHADFNDVLLQGVYA